MIDRMGINASADSPGSAFPVAAQWRTPVSADAEHPRIVRLYQGIDLFQRLLLRYADHHVNKLVPEALAVEFVVYDNRKLTAFTIRFDN